ncbi:hypothetical protein Bhyg_05792 [Pseudolycoriella hygida]|uniref:MD-2-related lipid-recognition domain-containing protein n=1 Tax=Pseudolycoriella hygida TaxID=35572 RepID=A0A9Q0S1D2_9DIPT|nr:hypothetical protein Bhyg_05792 [Pseudolycoriella hygida]
MLAYFLVAAVLPTLILGHGIIPCPGGLPPPTSLTISGCPASPCQVRNGDSLTYTVGFVPNSASPTMTLSITSTVLGETRDIELGPLSNACTNMSPACPTVANQPVTQSATVPIVTDLHDGIPAQLRVTITNSANAVQLCALINLLMM